MKLSRTAVFWIVAVAFVAFLAYSSIRRQALTCEVCMTFGGGDRCAKASGPTREAATETATTAACGPPGPWDGRHHRLRADPAPVGDLHRRVIR